MKKSSNWRPHGLALFLSKKSPASILGNCSLNWQNAINAFLRYHGFHNSGGLSAYPTSNYNRADKAGDFKVAVSLHPEMLLGHEHKTYFARDFTEPVERALAWVLWALFAHSLDIELELKEGYPAFW